MTHNSLITSSRKNNWMRIGALALMLLLFVSCIAMTGVDTAFAATPGGGAGGTTTDVDINTEGLDAVMDVVVTIVGKAALYIGIIIVLWGVFQIVLAFRREDSEGISKQITTVVVGGVLLSFGALAQTLYDALKDSSGS